MSNITKCQKQQKAQITYWPKLQNVLYYKMSKVTKCTKLKMSRVTKCYEMLQISKVKKCQKFKMLQKLQNFKS